MDIDAKSSPGVVEGEVLVKNGALPHTFPGGDPVLKQFYVTVILKTEDGNVVDRYEERFGKTFEELLRGPIPRPLVNGGTTRHIPFSLKNPQEVKGLVLEAVLSYALIPEPTPGLKDAYLATLPTDKDREKAEAIIKGYAAPRLLTSRTMNL